MSVDRTASGDVRRQGAGIKSGGTEPDEQQATKNKNTAEVEVPPAPSAGLESADDYNHQESHKSTERTNRDETSAEYDSAPGWREVYDELGCYPEGFQHE